MKPLFVLRNIAAVNFYLYAQDFATNSLGNTVFLGGNGSGKSILLDAIQIVMTGMNKRYLDLNSRVSEGGKNTRTVREACLGLLDDGEGYEREACLTYIALGFEASDGTRQCTAGVCLEAKASLDEETVLGLFVVEDVILRFNDFVHKLDNGFEEKAWQSFLDEQRRQGHAVHTFQRQNNRMFLRHLYSVINANARGTQLDPDRARAAMRQALSFDIEQITSVTEFVKRFLLDEAPIEIETFQARYATWRGLQKDIARVEAEIQIVESIRWQCERVMEDQFNARFWSYGLHRAEYDRYSVVIARQQREVAEMRRELAGIEAYKATLATNIDEIRLHLDTITRQIGGMPAYEQIKQAQSEKSRYEAARRAASIEAKAVFDALTALREATASTAFPLHEFPAIQTFVRAQLSQDSIGVYDGAWPVSPRNIAEIVRSIPLLSDAHTALERRYQEVAATKAHIAKDLDEVERQLKNLRSGGAFMSKETQDFIAEMAQIKVPAHTLSEVSDIAPAFAEWRGIIEAILGDWCDAVIVESRFMDQAYAHFDNHYKGTRMKLIQSENVSSQDQDVRTGMLAEAVTTDNSYARAFLNVRLGRIMRARSARDIRRGDLAASTDGKYAHGRGIEYRRLPSMPRLGKSIRDQQIARLTHDKAELEPKLRAVRDGETRAFATLDALKRAESSLVTGREGTLSLFKGISDADIEITRQTELISRLEATLPQDLLNEQRDLENDLRINQEEQRSETAKEKKLIENIGNRTGAMETNIEARRKSARQVLEAFPPRAQRFLKHGLPMGLEHFGQRARTGYRKIANAQTHPAHTRNQFETLAKAKQQSQRGATMRLVGAIQDYVQANPNQHPGFEWTRVIESEQTPVIHDWISLRHGHLTGTVLRNFKIQVDKAIVALVETMVHDFLSRLRANIDTVERIKDDLNRSLRGSVFMGEVYQIRQERDQDKETIRYLIDRLDVVAPKATALMQSDTNPNDPDQMKIKQLIEMLTFEGGDEAVHRRRLHELADYRSYFRFSIDICDSTNGYRKISDLEQRRGKASGGQKFVPFYICLGVAAASAYHNHLGESKEAPPQSALLLMDEAFEKLDPENIYKIICFYKSLGLQLIMAAPKTHQALYQETFNTLISIIRVGRAIKATAQHFHPAAHELLSAENPMHRPRSYFEDLVRQEREDAAE